MDDGVKLLGKLGITVHEILRYGYGGVLALFIAGWHKPGQTKLAIDALGVVLTTLAALAAGAALYTISRHVFGPVVVKASEAVYGWLLKRGFATTTTRYQFFRSMFGAEGITGVMKAQDAWRAIWRRAINWDRKAGETMLWSEDLQNTFYRQHSELHSLYVTGLVLLLFSVWVWEWPASVWFLFGFVAVTSIAAIAEILVSRQECIVLQQNARELRGILEQSGLIAPKEGTAE